MTASLEEAATSRSFTHLDRRSFLGGLLLGSAGSFLPRSLLAELGSVDKEATTLSIAAAKTARTLDPDAINSNLQWEDIEAVVNLYESLVVSVTTPNARGVHEAVFGEYAGDRALFAVGDIGHAVFQRLGRVGGEQIRGQPRKVDVAVGGNHTVFHELILGPVSALFPANQEGGAICANLFGVKRTGREFTRFPRLIGLGSVLGDEGDLSAMH